MELEIKNKGLPSTTFRSKSGAGFTLVELLIAFAVFSLIVVAMSATAVSVIKSQRKNFALQNSQEAARYILESFSKEIRMSKINSDDSGGNPTTDGKLNITNAKSETFDYQFDNINKILYRGGQALNSTNLEVTGSFYIRKSASLPARAVVTLVMKVKTIGGRVEKEAEIYLQSTISSRAF
ncbi:MAG: prepilin-type N-terminal cleavage/methylation domain-containing protein [Candidatus Portnoybacteria bacterium]|nr:prepilin-type N-terminal cleavage/methylation domain-containing protein [Candidatus Portnoybacteria bacterium]